MLISSNESFLKLTVALCNLSYQAVALSHLYLISIKNKRFNVYKIPSGLQKKKLIFQQ